MYGPGHPAGEFPIGDLTARDNPPSAADLRDIFDEHDRGGLSADSWVMLMKLGLSLNGAPDHAATLVLTPCDEDFEPALLEDLLTPERLEQLAGSRAEPSPEELQEWRERRMDSARMGGGGSFAVFGHFVRDDTGRTRFQVNLHVDYGSFDRVAGLYRDVDEATADLCGYGELEWLW